MTWKMRFFSCFLLATLAFPHASLGQTIALEQRPSLRLGMEGSAVFELQSALQNLGFYPGQIRGFFGPGTERAVRTFQRHSGLSVTGIADPRTLKALLENNKNTALFPPKLESEIGGRVLFTMPRLSNRGAPGQQAAAATRGHCLTTDTPLTALVPATIGADGSQSVLGFSLSPTPSFWFFLPKVSPRTTVGKFVLFDSKNQVVYQTTVNLEAAPGIFGLPLPAFGTPLSRGETYHWYFSIPCNQSEAIVHGWIQRTAPTVQLLDALETATPRQRAVLYAQSGFWHDALTEVANLDKAKAEFSTDWANLLNSAGLERFSLIVPATTRKY